jgi:putative zinc finger/helix-turn-helix YgiT family protein
MTEESEKKNEAASEIICPECGSKAIEIIEEDYKFTYGAGKEAIEITARVPVTNCKECAGKFLDANAEDICHEHICRHLGVMNPAQIKSLREHYHLSQAEFSHITKLGEATLSRWERGVVIQNQAYDNYLYLLGFLENLERVESRKKSKEQDSKVSEPVFREIEITSELLEQQRSFKLVAAY